MSQVAFIINLRPNKADVGNFIDVGNQLAFLVRNVAGDDSASLVQIAKSDNHLVAQEVGDLSNTAPVTSPLSTARAPKKTTSTIAGGAAGALTVTGIKKGKNTITAVVAVDDTTHAGVDLTTEFTITADNTINNTGGTSTASKHVVVSWV